MPFVVFVLPAVFGHAVVHADNEIQNLPLRVLAGRDLRHGHLPLWNPYIWSGSPLLGGLNAGALYPFTALFVVLPMLWAWTATLVIVYVTTAVGTYLFLRQQQIRAYAAAVAAATFSFAGTMSAQMLHLGIVEGVSWIPWMLLVEQRLARQLLSPPGGPRRSSVGRRVVLLGLLGGLVLLTGEPRAMADAALIVGLAVAWHALGTPARPAARLGFVGAVAVAAAVAAALGAVQLVPGWSFIDASQRAHTTVAFFGSGSLPVRWSLLLLVPDLLGGTGVLHQPAFFASYNLPEVTGYVGLVPLMAAAGLLAAALSRSRPPRTRRFVPWFGLVVVGLVLSFGTYTPLGRYQADIPFYGDLRLESRNLLLVGLGLCVLLAYWLDLVLEGGWAPSRPVRIVTVAPVVAVLVLLVVGLLAPVPLELWLGVTRASAPLGHDLAWFFVAGAVVALAALGAGLGYGRLGSATRARVLLGVIVVDLVLFTVTSVDALTYQFTSAELPSAARELPVPPGTRFALYYPPNDNLPELSPLGQNDLNDLVSVPSVEGYGSLTNADYADATGTRDHNDVSLCALARGVFVPLGLSTIGTVADELLRPATTARAPGAALDAPCRGGTPPPAASGPRLWWFGRPLSVTAVTVAWTPSAAAAAVADPKRLRVAVLSSSGRRRYVAARLAADGGDLTVRLATAVVGSGFVLSGPEADAATDATTVSTTDGRHWRLDGAIQAALRQARFSLAGYRDGVAVFHTRYRAAPLSLHRLRTAGGTAPGLARRLSTTAWGSETDTVRLGAPARLVRSVAYQPGWHAQVRDVATGTNRTVPVARDGLVQSITLAAGAYTVSWSYDPSTVTVGGLLSLGGLVVVAGAGVSWWFGRRRRLVSAPTPRAVSANSAPATAA